VLVAASLELKAEGQSAHSDGVISVAFSPDGKTIVSGSWDETIKVWDAVNFRAHVESEWEKFDKEVKAANPFEKPKMEIQTWWRNTITGHEQGVKPSGGVHMPIEPRDNQSLGCRYLSPPYSSPIPKLSTPMLATASLELKAEKQSAHSEAVSSVAFSPDGSTIVSGCFDQTIKVWDAVNFRPFNASEWEEVDFSGLLKDSDGDVKIEGLGYIEQNYWRNTVTGHNQQEKPSTTGAPSIVGTIKVWDAGVSALTPLNLSPNLTSPVLATASLELKAEKQRAHSDYVMSVAFSPDGLTIVSGSFDQTIKVWGVRPYLDSEWEEVDISGMPKDGDGNVKIEGLGYTKENYWRNTVTGDIEIEKPASGGAPIVV
jgi:WD40 repeat protein